MDKPLSGPNRRAWIAGAGAALFAGQAHAQSEEDSLGRRALDQADAVLRGGGRAVDALVHLQTIPPHGYSPAVQFELSAARRGLSLDVTAAGGGYTERLSLAFGGPIAPATARAWADEEIASLRRRAETLLRALGAWRGEVAADIVRFMQAPAALYADDAAGRAAAASDMAKRLEVARPVLAPAFDMPLPSATFRSLTVEEERAKRGGHRTADGYVVDLTAIRTRPAWTLPSVVFHETVPGHLLQARLQGEPHPLRLRYAGAFGEGWATYAEQLANDLGVYKGDPAGELGYLHWRLFRMARIVVDIGLNADGWNDAKGLETLRSIQGAAIAFATFEMDVARMRQSPGAFASQGLGALHLRRRRPSGRQDWAAYHGVVLRTGPVPMAMAGA